MAPPRKRPRPKDEPNPSGICQCGCGQPAPIPEKSGHGNFAGYPARFCHGHNRRKHARAGLPNLCRCGCGELVPYEAARGRAADYRRGHHMRVRDVRGPNNPSWKGDAGRALSTQGYVIVYRLGHPMCDADGYGLEHRVVLFDTGIRFRVGDVVHHIDGDRTNNRVENLQVMTRTAHMRLHGRQRGGLNPKRK